MLSAWYRESMWHRRRFAAACLGDRTSSPVVPLRSSLPVTDTDIHQAWSFYAWRTPASLLSALCRRNSTRSLVARSAWDVATHPRVSHTYLTRGMGRVFPVLYSTSERVCGFTRCANTRVDIVRFPSQVYRFCIGARSRSGDAR